jgi:UPF0271 protein
VKLDADTGDSFGRWSVGDDLALLGIVSSANMACGVRTLDSMQRRTALPATLTSEMRAANDWFSALRPFVQCVAIDGSESGAELIFQLLLISTRAHI